MVAWVVVDKADVAAWGAAVTEDRAATSMEAATQVARSHTSIDTNSALGGAVKVMRASGTGQFRRHMAGEG
jgi:hypothetical protein